MTAVHIVGGDLSYIGLVGQIGTWTGRMESADIFLFTGGADVHPMMYGEEPHPMTRASHARDAADVHAYAYAHGHGIPCIGICRGAQFLTVANGGKLRQHIEGHAIAGMHPMYVAGEFFDVTSTHHQMMVPSGSYELLGYSTGEDGMTVPEVVWYPNTLCLAVQYHPEYMPQRSRGRRYFMELVQRYIQ